jgi:alkanesulfonate monooxygenase SsuD/methylene tetrahydromethanopterin reductase-like flavin-dependent oxidoreductase (luciferase family)
MAVSARLAAVRLGIALPQYAIDVSPAGDAWATALAVARRADAAGLDAVWLSDHPFAVGPDGVPSGAFEALTAAGALLRATARVRVGTLVLASTMRSPGLVAHGASTLGPRFVAGVGAGWYEAEHGAFGLELPTYARRLERLESALTALRERGCSCLVGGSGPRVLELAARYSAAWNVAWDVPPATFAELSATATAACERVGRDPATLSRSVGLTVLVALDDHGIDDAIRRLRARAAFLADVDRGSLEERIIVGTPAVCVERIRAYDADEAVVALLLRDDLGMLELFAGEVAPLLR